MAFISILFALVFLLLLLVAVLCLFACAAAGLGLCPVFAYMYVKEKKQGGTAKRWKIIASALCGTFGALLSFLFIYAWFFY